MGLFDKVRAAAEKAFADPLPPAEDATLPWDDNQPMAVLVESEWLNNATGIDNSPGRSRTYGPTALVVGGPAAFE